MRRPEPLIPPAGNPGPDRDRDADGRPRQARPRDALGRPLPYGAAGVEPVSEEALPPLECVAFATQLLAEGRPFAAHEVFEARWKAGPPEERELWQGLAQICAGFTHAARGNRVGADRLVERGVGRVAVYAATGGRGYGLDLATIGDWARRHVGIGAAAMGEVVTDAEGRHAPATGAGDESPPEDCTDLAIGTHCQDRSLISGNSPKPRTRGETEYR